MITGHVTTSGEAVIRLTVNGPGTASVEVEAIIDTGYSGDPALPPAIVADLGLTWRRRGRAILADGSNTIFDIYAADVVWDGMLRPIAVDAADSDSLVGMRLLSGYELMIHVIPDGAVTISTL